MAPRSPAGIAERRRRYRAGHSAEWLAAARLVASGHNIVARRATMPGGEIDIIARRGNRIAFIEVKRRKSFADCEAAITPRLRLRVRAAASQWLARHPNAQGCEIGYDLVFVVPWRMPRHLPNGL